MYNVLQNHKQALNFTVILRWKTMPKYETNYEIKFYRIFFIFFFSFFMKLHAL